MGRGERIRALLDGHLAPEHVALVDESGHHSVPDGSESHWNLVVVSAAFEGRSVVQRHRLVYGALQTELADGGLHALTLKALTPSEWRAAGGAVDNVSPACKGGSKANSPAG